MGKASSLQVLVARGLSPALRIFSRRGERLLAHIRASGRTPLHPPPTFSVPPVGAVLVAARYMGGTSPSLRYREKGELANRFAHTVFCSTCRLPASSLAFYPQSGSRSKARPTAMRSTCPSLTILSAYSGSVILPTADYRNTYSGLSHAPQRHKVSLLAEAVRSRSRLAHRRRLYTERRTSLTCRQCTGHPSFVRPSDRVSSAPKRRTAPCPLALSLLLPGPPPMEADTVVQAAAVSSVRRFVYAKRTVRR